MSRVGRQYPQKPIPRIVSELSCSVYGAAVGVMDEVKGTVLQCIAEQSLGRRVYRGVEMVEWRWGCCSRVLALVQLVNHVMLSVDAMPTPTPGMFPRAGIG